MTYRVVFRDFNACRAATPVIWDRIVCDVSLLNFSVFIIVALFLCGYRASQISVLHFVKNLSLIMHKTCGWYVYPTSTSGSFYMTC